MQIYDIIMLVVLLFTIIMGYRRGLAWQVASVAAIVVSYLVAINFRDEVAIRINAEEPWNTFLAMLILYVATSFSIWVVFQLVKGIIDRAKLKEFDQQLGAILGAVKGGLLCIVITFFGVTLLGPNQTKSIVESRSGLYISKFLDKATGIMPTELSQVLGPYLKKLDEGLEGVEDPQTPQTYYIEEPASGVGAGDPVGFNDSQTAETESEFSWPVEPDSIDEFEQPYDSTATNPDPYYEPPTDRRYRGPYRR